MTLRYSRKLHISGDIDKVFFLAYSSSMLIENEKQPTEYGTEAIRLRNNLSSLRQSRKVSDVARQIGVSRDALYKMEKGTVVPSSKKMAALLALYGSPIVFLSTESAPTENK
jgi:DNA-binding XRE family transcriptional regulator